MCRRNILVTSDRVCVDNVKAVATTFFEAHTTAIFWGALLLMALCIWLSKRESNGKPLRDDNINYQLQNINNRLDGMNR
jgi:hypothetical protein